LFWSAALPRRFLLPRETGEQYRLIKTEKLFLTGGDDAFSRVRCAGRVLFPDPSESFLADRQICSALLLRSWRAKSAG
jgi:hypothetical protein